MYICLCNALTETAVHQAAADGACRPREVYAACGTRAQCGTCTGTILCILRKLGATASLQTEMLAGAD